MQNDAKFEIVLQNIVNHVWKKQPQNQQQQQNKNKIKCIITINTSKWGYVQ